MTHSPFIVWLKDADTHETSTHSKASKDRAKLAQAGFPTLPGFIVNQYAYHTFLKQNNLDRKIKQLLTTINHDHPESVYQVAKHIQHAIKQAPLPEELLKDLKPFFTKLYGNQLQVLAHTTGIPSHKVFAHTVREFEDVTHGIKEAWAQHFEPNHFWKRHENKHDHISTGIEMIVQVVPEPDHQGKLQTIDPTNHTKDSMIITVQHTHASDTYVMSKKNHMLIARTLTYQNKSPKLSYDALLKISKLGKRVEQHLYFPQEITWAIVGDTMYLTQTKPISSIPKETSVHKSNHAHTRGFALTPTIGSGIVKIIQTEGDLQKVTSDTIAVLREIKKTQISTLKKARGIIAENGNSHSEIASIIRQLAIPTIYGIKDATKRFKNGHVLTVHGSKGTIIKGGFH